MRTCTWTRTWTCWLALCGAVGAVGSARAEPPFADLPQGPCGGFETLAAAPEPTPLLQDRLRIRALADVIVEAPPSGALETRLFLDAGERELVILAEERFARPGTDLVQGIQAADAQLARARFSEVSLPSGLRAVLAVEPKLTAPGKAIPVAHAYTRLADDTLQVTHVFVNPAVVAAGSQGCPALAVRILSSLAPGTRDLDLSAGRRRLGNRFEIDVPAGFALVQQAGPDFDVFHVYAVRELAKVVPHLGIYAGYHPAFEPKTGARQRSAKILGQSVTWYESEGAGSFHGEVLVTAPEPDAETLHVVVGAPSRETAEQLARIAESLRRSR